MKKPTEQEKFLFPIYLSGYSRLNVLDICKQKKYLLVPEDVDARNLAYMLMKGIMKVFFRTEEAQSSWEEGHYKKNRTKKSLVNE